MDEVHLWWPSEAWKCPPEIMGFVSQIRKMKCTFLWASQHDEFVARRLRRLTLAYWFCKRYRDGHQYTLYEGVGFNASKSVPGERIARMNVVRKKSVMAMYDTTEFVEGSVEWGDGQGFEDLALGRSTLAAAPSGSAQRSGRPGGPQPLHVVQSRSRPFKSGAIEAS